MHAEAMAWLRERAAELPAPDRVVELGSRDVNGSAREAWPSARWTGVDLAGGPRVDVVADAAGPELLSLLAEWSGMALARCGLDAHLAPGFDLVVCCEVLEHAADAAGIVRNAGRIVRPGGALLVTCAGPGRAPHSAIDGGPLQDGEHYCNVDWVELRDWMLAAGFADPRTVHFPVRGDLYATATKE